MQHVITDHIDVWTGAYTPKSSVGRGSSSKLNLHGIKKLRELILELAVRGKLVPQDPNDKPALVLLERIAAEKAQLVAEGKIKKQKPLPPISEDEKPFDLPSGWEWAKLGSAGLGATGKTPSTKDPSFFEGNIPFIGPGQINAAGHLLKSDKTLSTDGLLNSTEALIGDILMVCIGGSIGKAAVADQQIGFNQQINAIRPIKILSGYLFYAITSHSFTKILLEKATGSATPIINRGKWEELLIPIPPLLEQHRIVTKVNELMALCDQLEQQQTNAITAHATLVETLLTTLTNSTTAEETTENWNRIAEHFDTLFTTEHSIDQLKQTILQLAVMGKLVAQNPADEPASVLLSRIADEKARLVKEGKIKKQKPLPPINDDEKPFELPSGWEWCRAWSVAHTITSGSRDWAKYLSDTGAKFVTMSNLSRGEYKLRLNSMRYVQPPSGGEGSRTRLEAGDLLISITGDVGNLGLIPKDFGEAYINQHTGMLRFMPECRNLYFPNLMRSPLAKHQYDAPQRGIKNSFRLGDIGEMLIPLPPIAEQHRIVAKVNELTALCDQLKTRIQQTQQTNLHLADAVVEQALG